MKGLREKFRKNEGFTLVEMLIVVAIIAILIAVSIPLVSSSLEKARRAVDEANARDAISLATIEVLGDNINEKTAWAYKVNSDHTGYLDSKKTGTDANTAPTDGIKGQSTGLTDITLAVTYDPTGNDNRGSYTTTYDAKLYPPAGGGGGG